MRSLQLLAIALAIGGCVSAVNDKSKVNIQKRAAFDLGCQDVQLSPLQDDMGYVKIWGATGCGRKSSYMRSGDIWVLESLDGKAVTSE
ncbi:MAG: hypothetical protein KUG77_21285 [Nannocystaceae bacterium]|nr:hypothetical protein [Nannocystaceae bacterium]